MEILRCARDTAAERSKAAKMQLVLKKLQHRLSSIQEQDLVLSGRQKACAASRSELRSSLAEAEQQLKGEAGEGKLLQEEGTAIAQAVLKANQETKASCRGLHVPAAAPLWWHQLCLMSLTISGFILISYIIRNILNFILKGTSHHL